MIDWLIPLLLSIYVTLFHISLHHLPSFSSDLSHPCVFPSQVHRSGYPSFTSSSIYCLFITLFFGFLYTRSLPYLSFFSLAHGRTWTSFFTLDFPSPKIIKHILFHIFILWHLSYSIFSHSSHYLFLGLWSFYFLCRPLPLPVCICLPLHFMFAAALTRSSSGRGRREDRREGQQQHPPYVNCTQPRGFSGFLVDMLEVIAKEMNFTWVAW